MMISRCMTAMVMSIILVAFVSAIDRNRHIDISRNVITTHSLLKEQQLHFNDSIFCDVDGTACTDNYTETSHSVCMYNSCLGTVCDKNTSKLLIGFPSSSISSSATTEAAHLAFNSDMTTYWQSQIDDISLTEWLLLDIGRDIRFSAVRIIRYKNFLKAGTLESQKSLLTSKERVVEFSFPYDDLTIELDFPFRPIEARYWQLTFTSSWSIAFAVVEVGFWKCSVEEICEVSDCVEPKLECELPPVCLLNTGGKCHRFFKYDNASCTDGGKCKNGICESDPCLSVECHSTAHCEDFACIDELCNLAESIASNCSTLKMQDDCINDVCSLRESLIGYTEPVKGSLHRAIKSAYLKSFRSFSSEDCSIKCFASDRCRSFDYSWLWHHCILLSISLAESRVKIDKWSISYIHYDRAYYCTLNNWSEWSLCSSQCGTGTRSRFKSVLSLSKDGGICPDDDSPLRAEYEECSFYSSCNSRLPDSTFAFANSNSRDQSVATSTIVLSKSFSHIFSSSLSSLPTPSNSHTVAVVIPSILTTSSVDSLSMPLPSITTTAHVTSFKTRKSIENLSPSSTPLPTIFGTSINISLSPIPVKSLPLISSTFVDSSSSMHLTSSMDIIFSKPLPSRTSAATNIISESSMYLISSIDDTASTPSPSRTYADTYNTISESLTHLTSSMEIMISTPLPSRTSTSLTSSMDIMISTPLPSRTYSGSSMHLTSSMDIIFSKPLRSRTSAATNIISLPQSTKITLFESSILMTDLLSSAETSSSTPLPSIIPTSSIIAGISSTYPAHTMRISSYPFTSLIASATFEFMFSTLSSAATATVSVSSRADDITKYFTSSHSTCSLVLCSSSPLSLSSTHLQNVTTFEYRVLFVYKGNVKTLWGPQELSVFLDALSEGLNEIEMTHRRANEFNHGQFTVSSVDPPSYINSSHRSVDVKFLAPDTFFSQWNEEDHIEIIIASFETFGMSVIYMERIFTSTTDIFPSSNSKVGIIVGVVIGGLVILCLFAIIALAVTRRYHNKTLSSRRDINENNGSRNNQDIELKGVSMIYDGLADAEDIFDYAEHFFENTYIILSTLACEVSRASVTLQSSLGRGSSGHTYLGKVTRPGDSLPSEIAVKTLRKHSPPDKKLAFLIEAAMLTEFKHPNIVSILGVVTLNEPLLMLQEIMYQPFDSWLDKNGGLTCNDLLLQFAENIAGAMEYLTGLRFRHSHLQASRIMLCKRKSSGKDILIAKLHDFGLSDVSRKSQGYNRNLRWTAPESYNGKMTEASDVFSFGILLWEIFSAAELPYSDLHDNDIKAKVSAGHRLGKPAACSSGIFYFMSACWAVDPSTRPSFKAVRNFLSQ